MPSSYLRLYRKLVVIGLLLSLVLLLSYPFLPDKKVSLIPATPNELTSVYGFSDRENGNSVMWLDEASNRWACNYRPQNTYGCGWDIAVSPVLGQGMDWSRYSALEVQVRYSGAATRLRVYLRNFNPAYATPHDFNSYKLMNMSFPVAEAEHPVRIQLSEFQVVGWWFGGHKKRLEYPLPEMTNITHVGVDVAEKGEHEMQVVSITLIGQWIKMETLLLWMLCFWMAVFLLEGSARFVYLYRRTQHNRRMIRELEEKQQMMQEENLHLENLANSDPLTGIYNRAGLFHRINSLERREKLMGAGVMILDLDHFKQLNDHYGHDMGDKVLRTFASLLAMNLRNDDIFARMGGEEFVVVCRRQPIEGVKTFAEKLRTLAGQCTFSGEDHLAISVSIGVAIAGAGEDFDTVLQRADEALYRAKRNGRNRVEFGGTL